MAENREELMGLRIALKGAMEIIDSLLEENPEKGTAWWNKRCSVLAEVLAKGGVVSSSDLIKIAAKYDISGSGVGGFVAGSKSGGGSLIKLGGEKRALTDKGEQQVIQWLKEDLKRAEKFGIDLGKIDN